MNFHHSDIFSSEWWISITGMNINHSDEFLFQWRIFVKEFLFLSSILTIIQSKPQPEFWPSSASACFCYNCFLFNQCLWQNLYNVKWVKSFKCTSSKKDIKWTNQLVFHSNLIFQPASKSYLGKFTKKQDKAIYQKNSC